MNLSIALINCIQVVTSEDVKSLLRQGADPSYNDNESLVLAICCCSIDIVKIILADKRVDPTNIMKDGDVRLCVLYDIDILNILIADGRVDFSVKNRRAIFVAKRDGLDEARDLLLQNERVKFNQDGF